jgi:hypothetical protein
MVLRILFLRMCLQLKLGFLFNMLICFCFLVFSAMKATLPVLLILRAAVILSILHLIFASVVVPVKRTEQGKYIHLLSDV